MHILTIDMFCCIGLVTASIVGGYLGIGNIAIPIGFISGITADVIIFRHLFGKEKNKNKDKNSSNPKQILSCCNISSLLNKSKKENH